MKGLNQNPGPLGPPRILFCYPLDVSSLHPPPLLLVSSLDFYVLFFMPLLPQELTWSVNKRI